MKYLIEKGKLKKFLISNPSNYYNDLISLEDKEIESFKVIYLEDSLFERLYPRIIFGEGKNSQSYYFFKIDKVNRRLEYMENLHYLDFSFYLSNKWKNEMLRISDLCPYESENLIYDYYLDYKLKIKEISK